MFDTPAPVMALPTPRLLGDAAEPHGRASYAGPDRRIGAASTTHWFRQMLDEVDYGMVLLSEHFEVLHVNHLARGEMDAHHPLQLLGGALLARRQADAELLRGALQSAARRGLRRLLTVGEGEQSVSLAVVPLAADDLSGGAAMMVVMGKRMVCGDLSVQWFAQNHSLTQAETRVLAALCGGCEPRQIARTQGVSMNTVRSQISSVRLKAGAVSIRDLVRRVSLLPPLVSAIRSASFVVDDRGHAIRRLTGHGIGLASDLRV